MASSDSSKPGKTLESSEGSEELEDGGGSCELQDPAKEGEEASELTDEGHGGERASHLAEFGDERTPARVAKDIGNEGEEARDDVEELLEPSRSTEPEKLLKGLDDGGKCLNEGRSDAALSQDFEDAGKGWAEAGRDVFAYFVHEDKLHAPANAIALRRALGIDLPGD